MDKPLADRGARAALALVFSFGFVEIPLGRCGPLALTSTELLIAALLAAALWRFGARGWRPDGVTLGLLAVLASMALTIAAVDQGRPAQVKFACRFAAGIAVYAALRRFLGDQERQRTALRALVLAAGAFGVVGVAQHFAPLAVMPLIAPLVANKFAVYDPTLPLTLTTGAYQTSGAMVVRASAVFDYCNTFAYFLVTALGAAVLLLRAERERYWREAVGACAALSLAALWLTYSRGGWLALAAGVAAAGVYLALGRRSALWPLLAAALTVVALATALATRAGAPPAARPAASESVEPFPGAFAAAPADTLETRALLWRAALQLWREAPWLGVGVDRFRYRFYDRLPRTNYDLFVGQGLYQPHNLVLMAAATQGVVGVVALGVFLLGAAREARRTLRGPATFPRAVAVGLAAAITAANCYDAMMFDSYVNLLLTTLVLALLTAKAAPDAAPVD